MVKIKSYKKNLPFLLFKIHPSPHTLLDPTLMKPDSGVFVILSLMKYHPINKC